MKKCINCGAENKNGSHFCQNCGSKLNGSVSGKSNKNIITRFKNANILVKIITIMFVFLIITSAYGITYQFLYGTHYTEDEPSTKLELFNEFDLDNDGAISLYEIEAIVDDVPSNRLSQMFDGHDKNDNGVLKGGEFDGMIISINGYYNKIEVLEKMEEKKADKEEANSIYSSSSHSSSSHKSSTQYVEGCPECGYDEIITYPSHDGKTIYQCSVCEYWSYYESDFIIDERYAKSE